MKKLKISVGILAFVGLAVLNFTQSESCFVSKALASSSGSSSNSSICSSNSSSVDKIGYNPTCTPCPFPKDYKTKVVCGNPVVGGKQEFCINSDC